MSQNAQTIDIEEAIRQLALDIHLLDELREMNNKFNIFNVLGVDQYEIRHSNMLAWLLDPQGNHGFGESFLKNFLRLVFKERKKENADIKFPVDENLLIYNLSNFKVEREVKTISQKNRFMDIVLTGNINFQKKIKIVIENKIHAVEGKGQLKDYQDDIIKNYISSDDWHHLFIYLSADGDSTQEANWVNLTYTTVVEALETSLKGRTLTAGTDFFIKHYLTVIRELSEGDSSINALCRKIYKKHREAIELIKNHSNENISNLSQMLINNYKKEIDLIIEKKIGSHDIVFEELKQKNWSLLSDKSKRYQEFYTPEMDDILPPGYGYKYFFFSRKDSISVYFELLGMGKNEYQDTMNAIIDYQIDKGRKCSRTFNQYRRIFSKTLSFDEKNMEVEVAFKVKELFEFVCNEQNNLIKSLNGIALKNKP